MNKKSWLIIGVVVLVALGVWYYFDSREDVGLGPFEISAMAPNGYACFENGKIRNSKTPCHLGLEDFPGMFFDNGEVNFKILVSSSLDFDTVFDLVNYTADYNLAQGYSEFYWEEIFWLDFDYFEYRDLKGENLILVGSPNSFPFLETFDIPNIQQGDSFLKISMIGDKYVLIVSGWSTSDVQEAMDYLLEESSNLQGTEMVF